jgi:K+-sensing histidine kinase KdpD
VIEEEADRLTELIENLLDASRLQAGALRSITQMSTWRLGGTIAERFRTQSDRHQIEVDFSARFPGRCWEMKTACGR